MKTATNSKNCPRPIQLLRFDSNKKLILTQQAIKLFSQIQSQQLCIVTVAGRYRTGKSYILNRVLLQKNTGFQVGPTINACTKGLWIWPDIVKIKTNEVTRDCLIVDTEGLGSLQEGENTDLKIFLMALLLSSYFIYNSVGSIDEKAIQNLGLVTNLAQMLFKQGNTYDSQQLINSFPSFMWLVRDFSLRLQTQKGQPISSDEYLENALKNQKIKINGSDHKNQIRKQLRSFFPDRNCFTLVRPTENERDLQNLSTLPEQRLRPQFVKLIKQFKQKIRSDIKPKKIKGKSITPQSFIQLCKYYVDMINSGKIPAINSHWDNLCIKQASRIIQEYRSHHHEKLSKVIDENKDTQYNIKLIQCKHKQLLKEACQKIDKSFLGKLQKQLSKQRLLKFLEEGKTNAMKEINDKKFLQVQQIVKEIFNETMIEYKENKLQTFDEIFERFEKIKQNYKHESRIYESFYENSKDVFQAFLKNLQHYYEQQQLVLLSKNEYLQTIIEKKTTEMKEKIEKGTQRIRELQQSKYRVQLENEQTKVKNSQIMSSINDRIEQNRRYKDMIQEYECRQQQRKGRELEQLVCKYQSELQTKTKNIQEYRIQLAKNDQVIRQMNIKQRKIQRQMQIFKNKCSQYLKENIQLNQQIQKLKKVIFSYEQSQRKIQTQNIINTNNNVEDIVRQFNNKVDQLNFIVKAKENQISTLNKILNYQKVTNSTLLKTPQNINMMSLKKSYELQLQNNKQLNNKLQQYQKVYGLCSFKCSLCKKEIDRSVVKEHIRVCAQTKNVFFDVSYQYNGVGQIQFVIDVTVDDNEWIVRKNIQNIKFMLGKLKVQSELFGMVQTEKKEDDPNCEQDRRIFLDDLFNTFHRTVWENQYLIQFFAIDIHSLNQKKQRNSSMKNNDILEENIEPTVNLMKTTKFSKKVFNFGPQML